MVCFNIRENSTNSHKDYYKYVLSETGLNVTYFSNNNSVNKVMISNILLILDIYDPARDVTTVNVDYGQVEALNGKIIKDLELKIFKSSNPSIFRI